MSWDVYVLRCDLPAGVTSLTAVEGGIDDRPLGSQADVHAALVHAFPGWAAGDAGWRDGDVTVAVAVGVDDPVAVVSFSSRLDLGAAMERIFDFADLLGAQVFADVELVTRASWNGPWDHYAAWRSRALVPEPEPPPPAERPAASDGDDLDGHDLDGQDPDGHRPGDRRSWWPRRRRAADR